MDSGASGVVMGHGSPESAKAFKPVKPLSKRKVARFQAEQDNCGVVYFSRIPPYLKPHKLRDMLSGLGAEVLRIYLAAEDTAARARRVRAGGNKKKNFTEGWVEFSNKRRAKRIASTLNNTPVRDQSVATLSRCSVCTHAVYTCLRWASILHHESLFRGRWGVAHAHSMRRTYGMYGTYPSSNGTT